MRDWIAFWNSPHSIYVNGRHFDVHYRTIADFIARHVSSPTTTVVDFGCGEALHADRVAAVAGRVILCEAPPKVRAALSARFSSNSRIEVRSPEQVTALGDGSVGLAVMISVVQYLDEREFDDVLALFHRLLPPGGLLIVGDVIPPGVSPFADAVALLRYGAAEGFLGAAIWGLVRTVFSPYSRLRSKVGLSLYTEDAMLKKLAAAGFAGTRAPKNVGPNPARTTFLARRG